MININGKTYKGNNLSVVNGKIFVDGEAIPVLSKGLSGLHSSPKDESIIVNITVSGNVNSIKCDCVQAFHVTGNVGQASTVSGDISCGNVLGSISAVSGDVQVNGNVGGSVSTVSGDINHK